MASAVTVVLALMLAGWAAGAGTSSAAPVGSGKASATKSVCGLGTGKKATGAPIKIGGIDMLIPGVDFTTIGKVAEAYFKCVNDNGGIRGRPIKYILYNEQLNPAQQAALARKLVESDKVVGDRRQHELHRVRDELEVLQVEGLRRDRRGRPGGVLRHPARSSSRTWDRATRNIGAAQALVRAGAKSLVVASPSTISAYADGGVLKVASEGRHPRARAFPVHAARDGREHDHPAARTRRRARAAASSSTSRPTPPRRS